jgi:hypothetical protein
MYLSIVFLLKCWSLFFIPARKMVPRFKINNGKGLYANKPGLNKRAIHCTKIPGEGARRAITPGQKEIK